MARDERGFTLIEILVVILIVAVLAAVAVPIFLRQRAKGYEDQIQSSLKNAAIAVESYGAANGGDYSGLDGLDGADLTPQGFAMPAYLKSLKIEATASEYCLEARHASLTGSSAWRRATYQSALGAPKAVPDKCP